MALQPQANCEASPAGPVRTKCYIGLSRINRQNSEISAGVAQQQAETAIYRAVGMNWQVMGFGDFSSMAGETDMILRNTSTGGVEVYDISNNQITGAAFMGAVGLNWQFSGVGNFSGSGESDMMLRNSNTGGLEVYDIANNQLTGAAFIGNVGVNWRSRASAISAASPAKPICCCATARPVGWKCTTSITTNSPTRPSLGRSVWSGSSRASPRFTQPVRPISCCGTSTAAHSRSTTLLTIN